MSELSERVAREHAWTLVDMVDRGGYLYTVGKCACGAGITGDDQDATEYSAHLTTATEAAVRETIAAESVTEWGVRFPSGKVVSHGPFEQSARDSATELARITDTTPAVVFATTTPWKDAP